MQHFLRLVPDLMPHLVQQLLGAPPFCRGQAKQSHPGKAATSKVGGELEKERGQRPAAVRGIDEPSPSCSGWSLLHRRRGYRKRHVLHASSTGSLQAGWWHWAADREGDREWAGSAQPMGTALLFVQNLILGAWPNPMQTKLHYIL